jgi:hypothetical protein
MLVQVWLWLPFFAVCGWKFAPYTTQDGTDCVCVCVQVQIGAMQVDLGTLVWERRVAMTNVPTGSVQIHLSGKDMGNFVSHPLFQQAASTAVQVC